MTSIVLNDTQDKSPGASAALEVAAIAADLERLKGLISDAGDRLLESFNAVGALGNGLGDERKRLELESMVARAVTVLQFQDIAMQLTNHAQRRLGVLQDCLSSIPAGVSAVPIDGSLSPLDHPVAQAEMTAGSIELF